jgi:Family of unknown function (DUF6776)
MSPSRHHYGTGHPYRRRHRQVQVAIATLVLAAVLAAGFYFGQRAAYSGMGISPETYREMRAAIPLSEEKIQALEHERDVSLARNEVDRAALELVRKEISGQKEKIMDLEESLRFYQSLMAPEEIARGLVLPGVELVATDSANRFGFRIVAQQEARKHNLLKGSLVVTVYGKTDGVEESLPLSALCEDIDSEKLLLRFRYFQAIEGELVLPSGFEPRGITLVARTSAPKKTEVREDYPWVIQERFAYVGK